MAFAERNQSNPWWNKNPTPAPLKYGAMRPSDPQVRATFAAMGGGDLTTGMRMVQDMACAAGAVYDSRQSYRNMVKQKDLKNPSAEEWPDGWRPIGDGFYGTRSSPYAGTGWTSTGSSHSEQHLGATVCVRTDNGGRYYNARDVLIAFRGTVRNSEWVADADMRHTTATAGGHSLGTTHNGFWTLFNEIYTGGQGSNTMEIFLRNYRPSRVFLTGHSLGGAMCHLATLVIPNTVGCPVTTCSYAAPRVSADSALDASYQAQINSGDITHFVRIVNRQDPVPMVPKGHGYHHPPSVKIDFSAFNSPETAHPHSMGLYKLYVTHSSNQLVYRRDDMA